MRLPDALTPLDEFRFHHVLAQTPGTSLVIFTNPGCSSCRAWKRMLGEYRTRHEGVQIFEVDAAQSLALTREFGVFHLPALFLYRDGHFHCALQSEARPEALRTTIESALAAPAQEPP
jgi:thioredoxin 1